jgi:hypothetical protein
MLRTVHLTIFPCKQRVDAAANDIDETSHGHCAFGLCAPQRVAHLRSVLNALEDTETPENSGAIYVREVRSAMNGDETLRVDLQKPIPKWILYGTAVV